MRLLNIYLSKGIESVNRVNPLWYLMHRSDRRLIRRWEKASHIANLQGWMELSAFFSFANSQDWVGDRECVYELLISFNCGIWNITWKKLGRSDIQYLSMRGVGRRASFDDQQATIQCFQQNVNLRNETLLLTFQYMNLNLKHWTKNFYGTFGNR